MGVDAVIELNPRTQIQDVAMVLTRLCGLKPYVVKDNGKEFVYVSKKIKITNSSVVGLANVSCNSMGVELKNRKGELKEGFSFCYHFQPTSGYKLMMPPSTGFWIAVGRRLVSIFGGRMDYADCDSKAVDYKSKGKFPFGESNTAYRNQKRLLNSIPVLTQKEISDCFALSAYDSD